MANNSNRSSPKSIFISQSKSKEEKVKKNLRFKLLPEFIEYVSASTSNGGKRATRKYVDSPSIKRKKDVSIPKDINDLEEDIERQLGSKAEKSNLSVLNVRNIIRSVITNEYVVDMLRQKVEEGEVSEIPFGPKLTRARTKELLQQMPDSAMLGLLTPLKIDAPEISPEVKLLIDKELPEDSSDEEYNPENEDDQSDDEDKGDLSIASDLDSIPATPAPITVLPTPLQDCSQDDTFIVPQENVGQRTRSKLNLNRLPLESLEQTFVPPDVTQDMYEAKCDNPDWHEFLKEFTQPLELGETADDDPDNDPEYNILEDEEVEKMEDKEEMRKDRAVKVSKRELNCLMAELFEITDNMSSDDEEHTTQTPESIAELEKSIMKETEDRQKREELEREKERKLTEEKKKRKQRRGFTPSQMCLLQQQLQQHVQLTAQHFLQCCQHPHYHKHADMCKIMLTTLSGLRSDKILQVEVNNLRAAINTVDCWEETLTHPVIGTRIKKFVGEQLQFEKARRKKKKNCETEFPKEMMRLVANSEFILYPKMLPSIPFRCTLQLTGPHSFTPAEDMLVAMCLEQVQQLMSRHKKRYKKRRLVDMAEMLMMASLPRSNAYSIAHHIRQRKGQHTNNPIKCLFGSGKVPAIIHVVPYVRSGVKLIRRPLSDLPDTWKSYLANEYQRRSPSPESIADDSWQRIEHPRLGDQILTISEQNDVNKNWFKNITALEHSTCPVFTENEKSSTISNRSIQTKHLGNKLNQSKFDYLDRRHVIKCKIKNLPKTECTSLCVKNDVLIEKVDLSEENEENIQSSDESNSDTSGIYDEKIMLHLEIDKTSLRTKMI